jgi:DNA-directed RNA polymerase specialized sigma24 family protein
MTECFLAKNPATCSNSWEKQYFVLQKLVKRWVYSSHVLSWNGQREDVVADIVQETVYRALERIDKAERQEASPIKSVDALCRTIARNLFIDFIRKDNRIVHLTQLDRTVGEDVIEFELADVAEDIDEEVFKESVFNKLAPEVMNFPKKQRRALLVDIANHVHFDKRMSPLQKAFFKVGVRLEDYWGWQPENTIDRTRFASLLSLSYKRLANLESMKKFRNENTLLR